MAWGRVKVSYSSLLETDGVSIREAHCLAQHPEPVFTADGVLRWQSKTMNADGEWRAQNCTELRETVLSSPDGSIDWHCLMPRAEARIANHQGLGYVERLTMTIPPWRLPIGALQWGRFLSESDWIIWIDCLGETFEKRIVYRNGERVRVNRLTADEIEFDTGEVLSMDRSFTLRSGPIGTTALSAIAGVRNTFPSRLLEIDETKWRSRARLSGSGAEGWAIHETVEWPP